MRRAIVLDLFVLSLTCAAERPFVWVQDVPSTLAQGEGDGMINPRDTIVVHVQDQPTLSGEFVVRDDGGYLEPTLGNVTVQGRTTSQVAVDVQNRLSGLIVSPRVTVSIARVAPIRVSVVGEVKTPGTYEFTRDRSVAGALAAAGWLTDFAAKNRIFVVRSVENRPRVRFRLQEITAPEAASARFRLRDGDVVVVE